MMILMPKIQLLHLQKPFKSIKTINNLPNTNNSRNPKRSHLSMNFCCVGKIVSLSI
uniref:Uncharacterized protein n=1 Tax=Anopheles minimus TaxID=112268 RepID=A0A182WNT9_9DIPT